MGVPRPTAVLAGVAMLAASAWAGKPLQVRVVPVTFEAEGCCRTLRVSPGGAGRLIVDTRSACETPGHQWRVSLSATGRRGVRSNVGAGGCEWGGLARMRVRAPGPYRVTVCHEGGTNEFPANMEVRFQYAGPTIDVEGPLPCLVCTTVTTTLPPDVTTTLPLVTTTTAPPTPTTTTTSSLPVCTTTSTLQPCGGYVGSAIITTTGSQVQTLIDPVPATGTLQLTITGQICHGGSFDCEHTYDYEFWLNDPSGTPGHVTNVTINGSHRVPDGAPTTPDANNSYVVSLPVVAGEAITAIDNDSVYNDNHGALGVTMNLVCSP